MGVWDPARHVVAPFLPPTEWPRWRAMDWGCRRPFSIGWYAPRPADPNKIEVVDTHAEDHCRDELRYAVTARVTLSKQDLARAAGGTLGRRRPVLIVDLLAGRSPKDVDLYERRRRRWWCKEDLPETPTRERTGNRSGDREAPPRRRLPSSPLQTARPRPARAA